MTQLHTILHTEPSSKLVSYNNTNLLEEALGNSRIPISDTPKKLTPEFAEADISSLQKYGITKKQLIDLHNQKLDFNRSVIEDFIWQFEQYVSIESNERGVGRFDGLFVYG